jgi:hypothetical protein
MDVVPCEGGDRVTMLMERMGDYVQHDGHESLPAQQFTLVVNRLPSPAQIRMLVRAAHTAGIVWDPAGAPVQIYFEVFAATLLEAVVVGVRSVEAAGLRALRIDAHDWVTLGDIAARIGRSRETVRLWATNRLGPGGFPPPVNPGRDTSFYSWAEVLPWLRRRLGCDLPDEEPVLAAVNLALQLRALAPRLRQMHLVRELVGR